MNTETKKYCAFNGSETFRQQMIDAADEHERLDHYMAGTYGDGVKACSVGCSVRSVNKINNKRILRGSHAGLAKNLGIPEFICRLQDTIFEGLPSALRPSFTGKLFRAIKAGADLSAVLPLFLLRVLGGLPEQGRADVVASIKLARDVLQLWADTGFVDATAAHAANAAASAANDAYAAAYAANAANAAAYAAYAAYAANDANDANAVAYAANAVAYAANAAAYAAYAAYAANDAYAAAYAAAYEKMECELLEIIKIVCGDKK